MTTNVQRRLRNRTATVTIAQTAAAVAPAAALTLAQLKLAPRWVHYEAEKK